MNLKLELKLDYPLCCLDPNCKFSIGSYSILTSPIYTSKRTLTRLFPFILRNWNLTNALGYFLKCDIPQLSKVYI
jgi:hypothetical protein